MKKKLLFSIPIFSFFISCFFILNAKENETKKQENDPVVESQQTLTREEKEFFLKILNETINEKIKGKGFALAGDLNLMGNSDINQNKLVIKITKNKNTNSLSEMFSNSFDIAKEKITNNANLSKNFKEQVENISLEINLAE